MKKSGKENFLIDGFPRNQDNVNGWKESVGDRVNVQCVLFFDCDEQVNNSHLSLSSRTKTSASHVDLCCSMP